MKVISRYVMAIIPMLPMLALGATVTPPRDLKSLVGLITDIVGLLIVLVFALTFLTFMWGVVNNWIIRGTEPESIEKGKKVVFASIIALVIMSSIWGILRLLQSSLFGG